MNLAGVFLFQWKLINQNRFWFSRGNYRISTTHVSNLCSAIILACRNGKGGEVYYVTDGKDVLFRDFIGKLLETVYKTVIPVGTPVIDSEMIYTMGTAFTINDNKARTQLGYQCRNRC
jgi:nucleoside-diphosphate-sugar epimerase